MNNLQFEDLLNKYLLEKITKQETTQFFSMLDEPEYEELLKEYIGKDFLENTYDEREDLVRRERIKQKLAVLRMDNKKTFRLFTFRRIAAAAAVLLLFSTGAYFLLKNPSTQPIAKTETQQQRFKNDVAAPGKAKATITLADGRTVALDSVTNGTLATQGNVKVIKNAEGEIVYDALRQAQGDIQYNTLANPRGSKVINLTLADGSKVWLNAESSLKYPVAFVGSERKVEITGEAYFEVAHNAAMPFVVQKNDVSVQVLGTHFNVNTYDDEAELKITLLEGSVKVSKNSSSKIIKPGEQAQLNDKEIKVVTADVNEVMAWKDGMFSFNGADIKTVMRQLARWYDVDIEYKNDVQEKFHVEMNRNTNVSNVFKILETTGGVHFKIEGNKITVMR